MLVAYPQAPLLVLGDFNNCRLSDNLPSFRQYVDITKRKAKTMALCYGNIASIFSAWAHSPLCFSDHIIIFFLLQYKPELKHTNPSTHSVTLWSEDATAQLHGPLACTDWGIFQCILDLVTLTLIMKYIKFCIHTTIPVRTLTKYPNTKP